MRSVKISIQKEDFSIEEECRLLRSSNRDIGALATFSGLVRELDDSAGNDQKISALYLEHYPGMTEKKLQEITEQAAQRWHILDVCIIHRIGELHSGEQIVFVAVSSMHRQDAFQACNFMMDYLKTSAPFWKKSRSEDGEQWVKAKQSDVKAAESWADTSEKR